MRTWTLLLLILTAAGSAAAQDKADPQDRATLKACLDDAYKGQGKALDCIGVIEGPCRKGPDAASTVGMRSCILRETVAWDERLNEAYRKALAGKLGTLNVDRSEPSRPVRPLKGADILRDAQRAWITFRDRKCDADGLPMEGGSGGGLLSVSCILEETARQTLWLEGLNQD